MGATKITVKEFARVNGHNKPNITFVIKKKYKADDKRTANQWEAQLIKDKVIDSNQNKATESTDSQE